MYVQDAPDTRKRRVFYLCVLLSTGKQESPRTVLRSTMEWNKSEWNILSQVHGRRQMEGPVELRSGKYATYNLFGGRLITLTLPVQFVLHYNTRFPSKRRHKRFVATIQFDDTRLVDRSNLYGISRDRSVLAKSCTKRSYKFILSLNGIQNKYIRSITHFEREIELGKKEWNWKGIGKGIGSICFNGNRCWCIIMRS